MASLKERLRKAAESELNLPTETVPTPELASDGIESITLRGMSGKQRDEWEASLVVGRGKRRDVNTKNVRARLVVASAIDDDGSLAFTDGDAEWVGNLRVDVLGRLFVVAQRLSGVSDGDVDELGKSSAPADSSASPTS